MDRQKRIGIPTSPLPGRVGCRREEDRAGQRVAPSRRSCQPVVAVETGTEAGSGADGSVAWSVR
ncbi:hypothetical protein BJY54_006732 [Streptomyces nodosus]|nr:hypothetical protein [Streptomyces nodosus]